MSKNYLAYLKLNTGKYNPGDYLVMIDGKVKKSCAPKDLKKMVSQIRTRYPNKIPSIAKVAPRGMMIL